MPKTSQSRRRFRFWVMVFLAVTAMPTTAILITLWVSSNQIISPSRIPLSQDHHQSLNEPFLSIQKAQALDNQVPYLAVSPRPGLPPGKRGRQLRSQLKKEGARLREYGETHGLLVLLHGRRGRKEGLVRVAERFAAVGFRCLIPDLPAHGSSPMKTVGYGSREFERHLASRLVTDAQNRFGWPREEPLGLWGISMGGAFAIAAASMPDRWDAVVVVSSFDQLEGVVADQLRPLAGPLTPLFGSALQGLVHRRSGLSLDHVSPGDWAQRVALPVFIAHGDADRFISPERGRSLYASIPHERKVWLEVANGNHDNVLITAQPVYRPMAAWFLQWMAP